MDPKPPNSKVQVVVVGDPGTGKSSLIISAMTEAFPEEVPDVLLPTSLPMDIFPDRIPVTIVDTSSDNPSQTFSTCQTADVIVLTYSCDSPSTLERLTTFWLPELRTHNISVPVIVAGCKLDLDCSVEDKDLEQEMSSLVDEFVEVNKCLRCSALKQTWVLEVFYYAQNSVLYPTAPLFDNKDQTLTPRLVRALTRIFVLSDEDHDGILNDNEINNFQIKYFRSHLQPSEISGIKKVVKDKIAEGCSDDGLTLSGFLFLQAMTIEKDRIEDIWLLLRKNGYDNNIMLNDDDYGDGIKELTDEAVKFLSECFYKFDGDKDGSLSTDDLENLFSTAPGKPEWFNESEEMMSLDGFISIWALMALSDPVITFAYLKYIGYEEEDHNLAFRGRKSERSCFQCFVFGLEKAGKSALLNWFSGKSYSEEYIPTISDKFAANMVEIPEDGTKKTPNSKVQVVVVGDPGTGKSSLIISAMTEAFPEKVPDVLLPTSLPMYTFPDRIPVTIVDTSSDNLSQTFSTCQTADVIVLTYSCDSPSTLERLTTFWLPELRTHNISVPVIVAGCKLDLDSSVEDKDLEQEMSSLMDEFVEVNKCLRCSALKQTWVLEVFYYAQNSVLYPTAPLFDNKDKTLTPRLVRALMRIFILSDEDHDGILNDNEINNFQIKYFRSYLRPSEISGIKKTVKDKIAEGCSDDGLTLSGFLFLQAMMIEKDRIEDIWLLLRKNGYDNNIMLNGDDYGDGIKELTDEAVKFLSECFYKFDGDKDGSLSTDDLENLFSTAPGKPEWFNESEEMMSLDGFISIWALMALSDPVITFDYLKYIGYEEEDHNLAFRGRKSERSCFQCFVFGPEKAGKSALLNWLSGKSYSEEYIPTVSEKFAANMVEIPEDGTKKTLILREMTEETVELMWSKKNSLATCDIAIFVYDSCSEDSWEKAMDFLEQFATHCENSGYQVPCLIVSAKNDLIDGSNVNKVGENVTMGVEIPVLTVSAKLRNGSNLFSRIVSVAQKPHMFIPETEDGIKRKLRGRSSIWFGCICHSCSWWTSLL